MIPKLSSLTDEDKVLLLASLDGNLVPHRATKEEKASGNYYNWWPDYLTHYDMTIRLVIKLGIWNQVMRENNFNPTTYQLADAVLVAAGKATV